MNTEDVYYETAKRLAAYYQEISQSTLQRELKIGYARAARLIDMLERSKVIGSPLQNGLHKALVPKIDTKPDTSLLNNTASSSAWAYEFEDTSLLDDAMYAKAVEITIEADRVSAGLLQRRLKIGYARAARLIDILEDRGAVGPAVGSGPRRVLITSLSELVPNSNKVTSEPLSWIEFEKQLEKIIRKLKHGQYVTLDIDSRWGIKNSFVQFIRDKKVIVCEAVSNVYLPERNKLSEDQEHLLATLGWQEPNHTGNWTALLESPDRHDRAAKLLVKTCRDVFGAESPSSLTYKASFEANNVPLEPTTKADDNDAVYEMREDAFIANVGDDNYGVSPLGVYSIGFNDEVFRISVLPQGPLSIKEVWVLIKRNVKPSIEKKLPKLAKFAKAGGNYQVRYLEEDKQHALWLVSFGLVQKQDINRQSLQFDMFQLLNDLPWVRAYLGVKK